jgi:hypothetical protein
LNGIGQAALEIQNQLDELSYSFCIIGGLAVVYWGTPRSTQDVDISLSVPLGEERRVADDLLKRFAPRIEEAADFAKQSRVLLIRASNGVPIDVAFAGFPIEQAMIERSQMCELQPGLLLRLVTAEDLVITKSLAARPQDVLDIRGIIDRQQSRLDRVYIESELRRFCDLIENDDPIKLIAELFD